jgi:LPXTG-motif cell wall-anchored protein
LPSLRTTLGAAAVAVAATASLSAVTAAEATPGRSCPPQIYRNTNGWELKGTASVKLHTGRGIVLTTLDSDLDKASWTQALNGTGTKIKDLGQLSYLTETQTGHNNAAALPAYVLQLDVNADGGIDTSLVYEPTWNTPAGGGVAGAPSGATTTWDVDKGSFWSSKTFGTPTNGFVAGAGGPPFYTLDKVQEMFPNARVMGYGINLGTYNRNVVARLNEVQFGCVRHEWLPAPIPTTASPAPSATSASPTPSATKSPSATPTATSTAIGGPAPTKPPVTTSPTPSVSPTGQIIVTQPSLKPVGNTDDDLPLTGAGIITFIAAGAVLVAAGSAAVLIARRRRTNFTA